MSNNNGNASPRGKEFPTADQYIKDNAVGIRQSDGMGWVNTNQVERLMDGYCEASQRALIRLAKAVDDMRKEQKRFFKSRMSYDLQRAKDAEKIVDNIVDEIIQHPVAQKTLF